MEESFERSRVHLPKAVERQKRHYDAWAKMPSSCEICSDLKDDKPS